MIAKCMHSRGAQRPTYLLGHAGSREAVLLDPGDDVVTYLAEAGRLGLDIQHVFSTDYGGEIPFGLLELREQPRIRVHQSYRAPFVWDVDTLLPGIPVRAGQFRIVLVRDALGAESFAVYDLEAGVDYLALATWPLSARRPRLPGDPPPLADIA